MSDIMTRFVVSLEEAGNMIDKLSNDDISKKLRKEYNKFKNINPPSRGDITEYYQKLERDINILKVKIEKVLSPSKPNLSEVVIEKNTEQPPSTGQKKRKSRDDTLSASSDYVPPLQQPQQLPTIIKASQEQKEALIYAGLDEHDIDKYGIVGDHSEYLDWSTKGPDGNYNKDILNIVAFEEERFHKYYNDTYTPGQLAKTYNKIAESFIIQRCGDCDGRVIIDYLSFIRNNPQSALPTLLWIDTFHDFKEERLNKGKRNLNNIIDYLCFQIYEYHWGKLSSYNDANGKINFQTVKDCVDIGHTYNFDKMYQNSFFNFESISSNINGTPNTQPLGNKPKVSGFHSDVEHTVLRPLIKTTSFKGDYNTQKKVAELLYNVSNVFINTTGGWEADFLYAYLMYNFKFDMTKDGLIQNLRDVFWNEIKADKKVSNSIPYYAKDVDKGSSNFFKGTNVILPASLFDANRSNSSDVIEHFIPIPNTTIPLCNGYEFQYIYEAGKCNLTLKYTSNNQAYKLCDISTDSFSNNSSCINVKKRNNYPGIQNFINELLNHKQTQKKPLKDIDTSINNFLGLITTENKYTKINYDTLLKDIKDSISKVYFVGRDMSGCVKIPNGQGMSPIDCVSVVIGLLIKAKDNRKYRNGGHPLSPISCKELDFWVALKRIGDFGQIMQCKQLGIPLFTNDNMQLLISMTACSSAIWTGDNSKVLWYDSNKDAILCNGLNPNMSSTICNKTRIDVSINNDNIIIRSILTMLDNLPTSYDYDKIPNNLQTNSVTDFLKNQIYNIPNRFEIIIIKNKFIDNDLLSYIYLKIQEQSDLLINNIEKLKAALNKELYKGIEKKLIEDLKQYPMQYYGLKLIEDNKIQNQITELESKLNKIIEDMKIKVKEIEKIITKKSNLDIKNLRQRLENKIQSQGNVTHYYNVIEKQLLLTGQDKRNYIQDTETLLQKAANIIESKYVDKLTELNDIRNGCIIEVEMGGEKKEESNYRVVHH